MEFLSFSSSFIFTGSTLKISAKPMFVEGKAIRFYYTENDYDKIIRDYIDAVATNTFSLIYFH